MSKPSWKIVCDVRMFLETRFPELALRKEDNAIWERWAHQVGYRMDAARTLVRTEGIRPELKTRAVLARTIPSSCLPFTWRKSLDRYARVEGFDSEPVDEVMLRLRYEALCWFMEDVLPRSTQFDSSDHPLAREVPRLNEQVIAQLRRRESQEWVDLDRVFECYRFTAVVPKYGREYHSGLFEFLDELNEDELNETRWQQRGEVKIRTMIERELAGDSDFAGSLTSYIRTYGNWVNTPDEGQPPYEGALLREQVQFLHDLDAPLEDYIPPDVIAASSDLWRGEEFVRKLARRFLIEEFPHAKPDAKTGYRASKQYQRLAPKGIYPDPPRVLWVGLVTLARKALEIGDLDSRLAAAATRIIRLERQTYEKPWREKMRDRTRAKDAAKLRETMAQMK